MGTYFSGSPQERALAFGRTVSGAAKVLPATATGNIFTVSGGRVIITGLIGTCTTVCTATATTVSIGVTPTVGTAVNTGIATATAVTSSEVGTLVSANGAANDGALIVGSKAGASVAYGGVNQVVNSGSITLTTSATNTGAFQWTLSYIVLDDGAQVVAV